MMKLPTTTFVTLAAAIVPAVEAQGFWKTCNHETFGLLNPRNVYAACMDLPIASASVPPKWVESVLNADLCFGNRDGELKRVDNGRYSRSCRGCNFENNSAWLKCECKNKKGDWARTRIDLDGHLTNQGGLLCCRKGICSAPTVNPDGLEAAGIPPFNETDANAEFEALQAAGSAAPPESDTATVFDAAPQTVADTTTEGAAATATAI